MSQFYNYSLFLSRLISFLAAGKYLYTIYSYIQFYITSITNSVCNMFLFVTIFQNNCDNRQKRERKNKRQRERERETLKREYCDMFTISDFINRLERTLGCRFPMAACQFGRAQQSYKFSLDQDDPSTIL